MIGDKLSEFINLSGCFIGYNNYPEFNNNIFLLFSTSESQIFKNFLERLKYKPMFCSKIEVNDYYVLYVFHVPKEYEKNYSYFKDSLYSMMDPNYKKHILKFHNYNKYDEGNSIYKILYRDENLYLTKESIINEGLPEKYWTRIPREIEIGNRIKLEEEIFTDELVKEIVH